MAVQDPHPQSMRSEELPSEQVLLDEDHLRHVLVDDGPYAHLLRVLTVDSTNVELARSAADAGFKRQWPHLSILTAEQQTGGRGRLARAWSSPMGHSLSTSIVLRPAVSTDLYAWLSLLAGVALVEVLREEHAVAAQLKWPNDVHIEGRKISGILASIAGDAVVLGIGINVLQEAQALPTAQSTSVLVERERAGHAVPSPGTSEAAALRTQVLSSVLLRFAELLRQLEAAGPAAHDLPRTLRDSVTAVMDTLGSEVRVELPDGSAVRGRAVGLSGQGAVIIEVSHVRGATEEGVEPAWAPTMPQRQTFSAGDVTHLRPLTTRP